MNWQMLCKRDNLAFAVGRFILQDRFIDNKTQLAKKRIYTVNPEGHLTIKTEPGSCIAEIEPDFENIEAYLMLNCPL